MTEDDKARILAQAMAEAENAIADDHVCKAYLDAIHAIINTDTDQREASI